MDALDIIPFLPSLETDARLNSAQVYQKWNGRPIRPAEVPATAVAVELRLTLDADPVLKHRVRTWLRQECIELVDRQGSPRAIMTLGELYSRLRTRRAVNAP